MREESTKSMEQQPETVFWLQRFSMPVRKNTASPHPHGFISLFEHLPSLILFWIYGIIFSSSEPLACITLLSKVKYTLDKQNRGGKEKSKESRENSTSLLLVFFHSFNRICFLKNDQTIPFYTSTHPGYWEAITYGFIHITYCNATIMQLANMQAVSQVLLSLNSFNDFYEHCILNKILSLHAQSSCH